MTPSSSKPSNALDLRISLAMSLHAQRGVYALLVGSGVSTGAGVPTGWGVVNELVRRAAAAAGDSSDLDKLDPDAWWQQHGDGQPLGYSGLLSALASTPAARQALLAGFFEPTDEDQAEGRKVPGPAHHAIARLVQRGTIRVILTTNFDRLIEQALEAAGILPQVVASASSAEGMEPLAHAACTVVKLHGDYASLEQLNTLEELSTYPAEIDTLLDRILDEYGLIICGWSGDWDHALVRAIERNRRRRYPMFWSTYGELGDAAKHLVAQHRAQVVGRSSADQFFPDVVSRLEAIDSLVDPPLTRALAVAQLKRALPHRTRHIELRDLIEHEVARVRDFLATRPQAPPSNEPEAVEHAHEELRQQVDILLHLLAHGVYLDRDQLHTDLWPWTIEQLMRARRLIHGSYVEWWDNLQHYPALLALRSIGMAAVAAHRDALLVRALREPSWSDRFQNRNRVPAHTALTDYKVLDPQRVRELPTWGGAKPIYPLSRLLRKTLLPVFLPLLGDQDSYNELSSRSEYRITLGQMLFGSPNNWPTDGEFVGEHQWNQGQLAWDLDFRTNGDRVVWGWAAPPDGHPDEFSGQLDALQEALKPSRRW